MGSEERFRNSRLTWEELEEIADDFEPKRNEHQITTRFLRLFMGYYIMGILQIQQNL